MEVRAEWQRYCRVVRHGLHFAFSHSVHSHKCFVSCASDDLASMFMASLDYANTLCLVSYPKSDLVKPLSACSAGHTDFVLHY